MNELSSREANTAKLTKLLADIQAGKVVVTECSERNVYEPLIDLSAGVIESDLPVKFQINIVAQRIKP